MKWTNSKTYGLIAFISGAGVMAVEMTASRMIAPYFGTSYFVWTSVIVTVLVAMSFGYWFGGLAASRGAGRRELGRIFSLTAFTLTTVVLMLPRVAVPLRDAMLHSSAASIMIFVGSLIVTALFFALPVFLLAMASPMLVRLWSAGEDTGLVAGRYFAVSTLGSVIGTLLPSLLLVPTFGSRLTMLFGTVVFLTMGLFLLPRREALGSAAAVGVFLLVAVTFSEPVRAGTLELVETPYQLVRVWEDSAGWRYLSFNEELGVQTVMPPDDVPSGYYYDYFSALPFLVSKPNQSVAVIGLAGGSVVRAYRQGLGEGQTAQVVGVEVDAEIVRLAQDYFRLDDFDVEPVVMDGRVYLETTDRKFDAIVVDAYSQQFYIPQHLVTREFFSSVRSSLAVGGILAMNVNADGEDSPMLKTLANTVSMEFEYVYLVPVAGSWNWLLFGSETPVDFAKVLLEEHLSPEIRRDFSLAARVNPDRTKSVFTDDWAPIELMMDTMVVGAAMENR